MRGPVDPHVGDHLQERKAGLGWQRQLDGGLRGPALAPEEEERCGRAPSWRPASGSKEKRRRGGGGGSQRGRRVSTSTETSRYRSLHNMLHVLLHSAAAKTCLLSEIASKSKVLYIAPSLPTLLEHSSRTTINGITISRKTILSIFHVHFASQKELKTGNLVATLSINVFTHIFDSLKRILWQQVFLFPYSLGPFTFIKNALISVHKNNMPVNEDRNIWKFIFFGQRHKLSSCLCNFFSPRVETKFKDRLLTSGYSVKMFA